MAKYSLIGVDGNAFAIMGYTARALKREGLGRLVDKMFEEAKSGDYWNLIAVCDRYVDMANAATEDPTDCDDETEDDEDEEDDDEGY